MVTHAVGLQQSTCAACGCVANMPFLACKHKKGFILDVASIHSRATLPLFGIYAAMKAGVVG
jgi:hypothetical protein